MEVDRVDYVKGPNNLDAPIKDKEEENLIAIPKK